MSENQRFLFIWGAVSLFFAVLFTFNNESRLVLLASGFAKFFGILVGTALGTIGAGLGEAIRRFALPDGFFTNGGVTSILKTKLFWMVGPQVVGMLMGVLLGISIVLM